MRKQSPLQQAEAAFNEGLESVVLFGPRLMVGHSASDLALIFENGGVPVQKVELTVATVEELQAASVPFIKGIPMAKVTITFRR